MSPFILGFLVGVSFLTVVMIMGIIASLYTAVLDEKTPAERKKYTFWVFLKELHTIAKISRAEEKKKKMAERRARKLQREKRRNAKKK